MTLSVVHLHLFDWNTFRVHSVPLTEIKHDHMLWCVRYINNLHDDCKRVT